MTFFDVRVAQKAETVFAAHLTGSLVFHGMDKNTADVRSSSTSVLWQSLFSQLRTTFGLMP